MTGILEICIEIASKVFGPEVCKQGVQWFRQSRRPMLTAFCLLHAMAMLGLLATCLRGPSWLFLLIWAVVIITWIILVIDLRHYMKLYYVDEKTGAKIFRPDTMSELVHLSRDRDTFERGISLGLLDIDNFKQYNTMFGREPTDKILAEFAHSLRNACRQAPRNGVRADEIYRYYERRGDEFLLVLFNVSLNEAVTSIVRRILETYYNSDEHSRILFVNNNRVPPLVLSCGVIQIEEGDNETSLRERLDKALGIAKKNKNGICGLDTHGWQYTSLDVYQAPPSKEGQ